MSSDSQGAAAARAGPRTLRHGLLVALVFLLCQAHLTASAEVAKPAACRDDSPPGCEEQIKAGRALQTLSHLPPARVNAFYRRQVVYGGAPDYVIDPLSIVPWGMRVTPQGYLEGKPSRLGANILMLIVHDSAQPTHVARGLYTLTVLPPPPVMRPAPVVRRPPPPPPAPAGQAPLWSLSQGDVAALGAPPPPPAAGAAPPAMTTLGAVDPRPPAPGERSPLAVDLTPSAPPFLLSAAQQERLAPIVNLEYPTLALFTAAVHARLDQLPKGPAVREADVEAIARQAFKPQDFRRAPRALLANAGGCSCVPPPPRPNVRNVYGFFPFWRPAATPQGVNFGLFDRVEVLGAQLQADGSWLTPTNPALPRDAWAQDMSRLAATAQARGSHLDLILQGADWTFLASDKHLEKSAIQAADSAYKLATQGRPAGVEPFFRQFLLPIWQTRPSRVFDGVTVMFQPPVGSDYSAAFDTFFDQFVKELAVRINEGGQPFYLNIVTPYAPRGPNEASRPETLFGPGAFSWERLLYYLHQQSPEKKAELPVDEQRQYPPALSARVRLLVFLPSPTSPAQKALEDEINHTENDQTAPYGIEGHRRVTFTDWLVPILFDPVGAPPAAGDPSAKPPPGENNIFRLASTISAQPGNADNLDADLFFLQEHYGGVGLWPIPVSTRDAGPFVNDELKTTFFAHQLEYADFFKLPPVCSTILRLSWQLLIVLLAAGALFFYVGNLSPRGRSWVFGANWVCFACVAVLGFTLLELDPALDTWKLGNKPFFVTLAALIIGGLYVLFRPKIRQP